MLAPYSNRILAKMDTGREARTARGTGIRRDIEEMRQPEYEPFRLALGVLAAVNLRLTPLLVVALSAALGLVHGSLSGAGLEDAWRNATTPFWAWS